MNELPAKHPSSVADPPSRALDLQVPPKHHLHCESVPQGGVPGAIGHAGRPFSILGYRRPWRPTFPPVITILILALMTSALICPRAAYAESYNVNYNSTPTMTVYYLDKNGNHLEQSDMPINFPDDQGNTYHCIEPHKEFHNGMHTSSNATTLFSQAVITKLGMAEEWLKSPSHVPSAYSQIVGQVFMWKILHEAGFGTNGSTSDFITKDYDSTAAYRRFTTWYNDNKDFYTGHGVILTNSSDGSAQRIARFWAEESHGDVTLRKVSKNTSVTNGNDCYSLEGARYGIWKDQACTQSLGASYDLVVTSSGTSNTVRLPLGTYWVKEKSAPKGYVLDTQAHKVTLQERDNEISLADEPLVEYPDLLITKRDAQMGKKQGEATLAGARYTFRYYDGFYHANDLPDSAERTWIFSSDDNGRITLDDNHKVDGDDFYRDENGSPLFPLGTITVQETAAPVGYLLEGQDKNSPANYSAPIHILHVDGTGSYAADISNEQVIRGGVSVGKVSRETLDHLPQGEATLEGAVFSIVYVGAEDSQSVLVAGREYERGSEVAQIVTNADGIAQTNDDLLPYGTYRVSEIVPPTGYLLNSDWQQTFAIRENGVVVNLSNADQSVADQVMRGGFHFNKTDEKTMERMPKAVFRMTSNSTGESHILVADENGIVDTERNDHAHMTNGNDAAVNEEGVVDENKISDEAGIWFSGRTDTTTEPNDEMCALPYDVYTVEELPSSVNEGRTLVTFTIRVHRHNQEVDMGTVDDPTDETPEPHMGTTCTFDDSQHVAPVSTETTIVDHVRFENLVAGQEYVVVGRLVFKDDGTPVLDANDVAVENQVSFTPNTSHGEVEVPFALDSSNLNGKDVVAFEQIIYDDQVVCSHEDLDDEAQTVHFPHIETTLADKEGNREVLATRLVTLVDTVTYQNLIPGRSYELVGTLYNKETGEPLRDDTEEEITATSHFIAEKDGTATVKFLVDADVVAGKHVVAFERLRQNGIDLVTHEDIDDEDQTVLVPSITTSMTADEQQHEVKAEGQMTLVDAISYSGLQPGKTYLVEGTLMDKESQKPLTDDQGNEITSSVSFVPEQTNGSVDVPFSVNAASLAGKSVVAFERLQDGEGEDAKTVALHEDIDAQEQTVGFPNIETNASDADDHDKELKSTGTVSVIDVVTYTNLTPGTTYLMQGTLHDKQSGRPLTANDGAPIASEQSFVPSEPNGTVELRFSFDASIANGIAVVAFETCSRDGMEVATHADLNDRNQTVYVLDRTKVKTNNTVTGARNSSNTQGSSTSDSRGSGRMADTGDDSLSAIAFFVLGILCLGGAVAYVFYHNTNS